MVSAVLVCEMVGEWSIFLAGRWPSWMVAVPEVVANERKETSLGYDGEGCDTEVEVLENDSWLAS